MDKLTLHSPDLTQRNLAALAELFPNVITETRDADGNLIRAVDFDRLRQELADHVVEGPQERYQLDWPGKRAAQFAANAPIAKTLRPDRAGSVDFDTTQNLFIEGDNLDALKLLQESYLGKVKLIYIDPPYNTGKDFIYKDRSADTIAEYLKITGQADDKGGKLVSNPETEGRYHSNWLSEIYPRIKLARTLLSDTGLIMVSINDAEAPRLRQIMDEIYGQGNFLGQLVWMKGREGGNDNNGFGQHHEYVVVYARNKLGATAEIALDAKDTSRHMTVLAEPNLVVDSEETYRDGEPFQLINLSKQKDYVVQIPLKDGTTIEWPSYAPQKSVNEFIRIGKLFVGAKRVPYVKSFLADEAQGTKPSTIIESEWGTTKAGGISIRELFGSSKLFSYPKPPSLIQRLIQIAGVVEDAIVVDFYSGSSATAHAVIAANAADGGRRRFIMVQLAELFEPDSEAAAAGFATISDFSRERIRRAGAKIKAEAGDAAATLDIGFRALRVDTTNKADVLRTPDQVTQAALPTFADSVKPDRTGEDLLFEVLLDWGLELTLPITRETLEGREVFVVDDGALIACFAERVTPGVVTAIARRQPLRAVFRDSGFATDAERINAEQIFREVSPATDVKAI